MVNSSKASRRVFFMTVAVASVQLSAGTNALAQTMVAESDAQAASLGYKADASKTDKAKYPKYVNGQMCGNCALYQGAAGSAAGACPLFAGKQVAAKAWCSAYAKKA